MAVTLYGFGAALGLPDISPFCSKLETYLKMASIPFEKKPGAPFKAPKKKLPYINHDGHKIGDSSHIIEYLAEHFPNDLHASLTPQQQAIATLTQGALEEKLYFGLLYFRWQDDEGWSLYKDAIGSILRKAGIPRLVLPLMLGRLRKGVISSLHSQGTGRHTKAEICAANDAIIDAVAALLGDQDYFFGDTPRVIDTSLFAMIDAILTPPVSSPTQEHTRSHANLVAYVHRVRKDYFGQTSA